MRYKQSSTGKKEFSCLIHSNQIFVVRFTERRVGNVATHGRESGEPRRYTSTHGNGTKANGHCLGGQQHSLHSRERSRQTDHRLQEVLVRAKSAHRSRMHYEFSVYGRSARRDSLHGKWVSATAAAAVAIATSTVFQHRARSPWIQWIHYPRTSSLTFISDCSEGSRQVQLGREWTRGGRNGNDTWPRMMIIVKRATREMITLERTGKIIFMKIRERKGEMYDSVTILIWFTHLYVYTSIVVSYSGRSQLVDVPD